MHCFQVDMLHFTYRKFWLAICSSVQFLMSKHHQWETDFRCISNALSMVVLLFHAYILQFNKSLQRSSTYFLCCFYYNYVVSFRATADFYFLKLLFSNHALCKQMGCGYSSGSVSVRIWHSSASQIAFHTNQQQRQKIKLTVLKIYFPDIYLCVYSCN